MTRLTVPFRRLLIVALWLGVSATSAWAQQADIARADALMKQGNAAAAFAILDPLEDKMAGDVNFDYLFGISALDSGKADRATIAFERVLAVNPNNAGARLDMARAYFQLGDLERAKNEFETVRGQNPPPAVQQVVTTYLDTIEKAQAAKRRQLRFYVEGTVGRDSNVNNSTSQSQIGIPALNNVVFTLNPSNVKLRDSFSSAAGGVDFLEQLRPDIAIFAGGDARKRVNFTQDTFDNSSLDGRVGVLLGQASNQLRLGTTGGRYTLDNTTNRKTSGVNGEWKYQLNPANQLNLFSQYTRTRFLDAATRVNSFNQSTSGVGWLGVFADGKAAIFGNYFMGNERDPEGRADGAKNFDGVRIGGQYSLMQNIDLFAVASAQAGKYQRQNAAFLTKRGDDQSDLVFGGTWRFAKDWSLRPQLVHSRNTSNIPIYAFKRTEFSLTVRRDFN